MAGGGGLLEHHLLRGWAGAGSSEPEERLAWSEQRLFLHLNRRAGRVYGYKRTRMVDDRERMKKW